MATIYDFSEVYYLLNPHTESSGTYEPYGKSVEDILSAFPDDVQSALPLYAKESLRRVLADLEKPEENFDTYRVDGRLYVYHEELGPIKRVSFSTYIYEKAPKGNEKKKKDNKELQKPIDKMCFVADVLGNDLSNEPGILKCDKKWQLYTAKRNPIKTPPGINKEKNPREVTFEEGIAYFENSSL